MRRLMSILACLAACSLGVSTAFAGGPGCSAQKSGEKTASCSKSASSCCSQMGEFPTMVRMVGDKSIGCPMTAEKMAKESNSKVMFAVAGEKFDSEPAAWEALADNSEMFVKKFTTIACVMEGKTYFVCDEGAKSCSMKSAAAAGCCKSGQAKTASAGGATCNKGDIKTASAGSQCNKSKGEAKVVKVEENTGGSKATDAKSAGCSKSCVSKTGDGSDCCKTKEAKMAVIDSKTCAEMCKNAKDAKFMVAGRTLTSWDEAVKARDEVRTAINNVKMKYIVDGKEVDCASKVCPKAKAAHKVKYVVGEKNMECELMARVELAKAQYDAAKSNGTKTVATKM